MAAADSTLDALVVIAVGILALAFPFVASGYHIYQGAQVLIFAVALLGLNLLTGFNGQISLGHGAFFAIGGYGTAILITKFGLPYWAAIPLASVVCFIAGFLFGFPALEVRRPLSCARHLRARGRNPADPELHGLRRLHRRLAGPHAYEAARAVRALPTPPTNGCTSFASPARRRSTGLRATSCAGRIGRALVAIRDQPIAAETMGINAALYKTTCFGVSALYAGVAGGLSALAVGFVSPESFGLALSLAFLVGIVVGGLASLGGALFGALFIEFVPNIADQLTVSFGEGAKALPGAIYGALLILVMAAMPTGVAGAARAAARAARFVSAARKLKKAASMSPRNYEGKGEAP